MSWVGKVGIIVEIVFSFPPSFVVIRGRIVVVIRGRIVVVRVEEA